ncbi:MAG TPA: amylo-alpha-1,6-glucosidase, partial [Blastocatellia bacterium]|nr:amylo-alpha-1,6-glucosidase [Blastocatellia bacterium]
LDAQIKSAMADRRPAQFVIRQAGDVQFAEVVINGPEADSEVIFDYIEGTGVYAEPQPLTAGATNQGLRILRARADATALRLTVEGLGGHSYTVNVRTPKRVGEAKGVTISQTGDLYARLTIQFTGPADAYVRRELVLPLTARR